MKKDRFNILIVVLIALQLMSILRINKLQRELENMDIQMSRLSNSIRNDMNSIYSNVDNMIKKEQSLIEISNVETGEINVKDLTVPITFTLVPKEVSNQTFVSLDFDGELFPMEKKDTSFSVTVHRNIFTNALPKIIIEENGIKKIMADDSIGVYNIKEGIFPTIYPRLMGTARFSGNTYTRQGTLSADVKETKTGIIYKEIRLVIKVDDKLISDEIIPNEIFYSGYEVDEKIPLKNGEICTMTIIATDSIGLEHHYIIDSWIGGANSQREPWFGEDPNIYSIDGKLLWKPEYREIY